MMRFDRFTERAQDAASKAYDILQRYGHNQVDTEHLLLALLKQDGGGSLMPASRESVEAGAHFIYQEGREVYKFAVKGMAGITAEDVSVADLYSCFPSAVQIGAREIGLDLSRPLFDGHVFLTGAGWGLAPAVA